MQTPLETPLRQSLNIVEQKTNVSPDSRKENSEKTHLKNFFLSDQKFGNQFRGIEKLNCKTDIFDSFPPKFQIQKMKIKSSLECTDVNS